MSKSSSNARFAEMSVAALSLGSNMGERENSILEAARRLGLSDGIDILAMSSLYETEPIGPDFNSTFVNAACTVESSFDPFALLNLCKELERAFGRGEDGAGDRILDIDIVLYGDKVIQEPELVIPHPRFKGRLFVLRPLAEIAPQMTDPATGERINVLCGRFTGGGWVRRISSRCLIS